MKILYYDTLAIGETKNEFHTTKWQKLLNCLFDIFGEDDIDEALIIALNYGKLADLNNLDIDIIIGTLEYYEIVFLELKKIIIKFIGERS